MRKSTIYKYALLYCRQELEKAIEDNRTAKRSTFATQAKKNHAKVVLRRLVDEEKELCELLNAAKQAEAAAKQAKTAERLAKAAETFNMPD